RRRRGPLRQRGAGQGEQRHCCNRHLHHGHGGSSLWGRRQITPISSRFPIKPSRTARNELRENPKSRSQRVTNRAADQPLTGPDVRPLMNSFCRAKKSTAGGIIVSAVPARKTPWGRWNSPRYSFSTTGNVSFSSLSRKMLGVKKAFQLARNATRQNAAAIGRTSGITTR